jgi:hypothetical protein
MRLLPSQPPPRRVEGLCRLPLVVEAAEVLKLPAMLDLSDPLAVPLVHAHNTPTSLAAPILLLLLL